MKLSKPHQQPSQQLAVFRSAGILKQLKRSDPRAVDCIPANETFGVQMGQVFEKRDCTSFQQAVRNGVHQVSVLRGGVAVATIAGRGRASSLAPEGTFQILLCRQFGGERRRQLSSLTPRLPSTSTPSHSFDRWQTGRNPRAGSLDLGVRAPSLPSSQPHDSWGAGRLFRSVPLFRSQAA